MKNGVIAVKQSVAVCSTVLAIASAHSVFLLPRDLHRRSGGLVLRLHAWAGVAGQATCLLQGAACYSRSFGGKAL